MCKTTISDRLPFVEKMTESTAMQTQRTHASDRSTTTTVAVCCGCRPKAKRKSRKYRKEPRSHGLRRVLQGRFFKDATEWEAFHHHHHNGSVAPSNNDDDDDDSMFFFDAVDHPLGDDEYPIDGYVVGGRGKPRVVFTTSIEHPAPSVSLEEPTSMLRRHSLSRTSSVGSAQYASAQGDHSDEDSVELVPIETPNRIANHKEPSLRFRKIRKRSTEDLTAALQAPSKDTGIEDAIGMAGYPGTLKVEELEECQKFLAGLQKLPPAVLEQVYSFRDIEEQPYTICRWLRATKFDAGAILARLSENQSLFETAKEHDFYGPNIDDHLGCPLSVFLSQYPFLSVGRGRNGSPVNYFLAGKINPEGIMALCTIEQLTCYFWWSFMYKFKDEMHTTQQMDPDFCRCEGINVVDLSGLSASALTTETMEVIKNSSKVSDFFPETLHGMLVLNAPGFFAFSWKLIRNFIDPRTASRIQLFSSREKGLKALEKLVDKEKEIPTDYGGNNITLREAFLRECKDPQIVRQEIELVHCKRRASTAIPNAWTLGENECMEITVYTRSIGQAQINVSLNGLIVTTINAQCRFEGNGSETKPLPNKVVAVSSESKVLVGPGEVVVEAKDLDSTIPREHSSMSRGYFLIVGDTKQVSASSNPSSDDKPHVRFSDDNAANHQVAAVTMTGLSAPKPAKSSLRKRWRLRRANE